mgnify:CR=1 FL=1
MVVGGVIAPHGGRREMLCARVQEVEYELMERNEWTSSLCEGSLGPHTDAWRALETAYAVLKSVGQFQYFSFIICYERRIGNSDTRTPRIIQSLKNLFFNP